MLGVNALIGFSNNKILVIQEISATKYLNAKNFPFSFVKLNVSPKTFTPQFGFSFLFVELSIGCGFSMNSSYRYKTHGFRANFNINIPLKMRMKLF